MAGATQRGKSAAIVAILQPAMRWAGLGALIAAFWSPLCVSLERHQQAQTIAGDEAPCLPPMRRSAKPMRAGDKTAARRLLALQFSFVDADGKIHARKDFLADLKARRRVAGQRCRRCAAYGLLATVTGHRISPHDAEVFFLDIWAKQKGAWRALLMQDVATAMADAPVAAVAAPRRRAATQIECRNPCQTIPYRVRSPAEQDIVLTFQAIEKAVVAHDAG